MRQPLVAALLFLLITACARPAEELLPIPPAIKGANHVVAVELIVRPNAANAVAATDERARLLPPATTNVTDYTSLPFARLMPLLIEEATRAAGLISGRALKLIVEIDDLRLRDPGAALIGKEDRLAGSVFVRDAVSGEPLGHLYIDLESRHPGLVGLVVRGGGVRERLADAFALRVADALAGRNPAP